MMWYPLFTFKYSTNKLTWAGNVEPKTRESNSQMLSISMLFCFSSSKIGKKKKIRYRTYNEWEKEKSIVKINLHKITSKFTG